MSISLTPEAYNEYLPLLSSRKIKHKDIINILNITQDEINNFIAEMLDNNVSNDYFDKYEFCDFLLYMFQIKKYSNLKIYTVAVYLMAS